MLLPANCSKTLGKQVAAYNYNRTFLSGSSILDSAGIVGRHAAWEPRRAHSTRRTLNTVIHQSINQSVNQSVSQTF